MTFLVSPAGTSKMAQTSGYMAVRRSTPDTSEPTSAYLKFETTDAVQVRSTILNAQEHAPKGEKTPGRPLEGAAAQVKPLLLGYHVAQGVCPSAAVPRC